MGDSLGSCCPEDLSVQCRLLRESDPRTRGPQSPVQSDTTVIITSSRAAPGSPKVGSRMVRGSGVVAGGVVQFLDKVFHVPVVFLGVALCGGRAVLGSSNFKGLQRRRAKLKNKQKWLRRKPALQSWRLAWSRPQSKRRPNSTTVMLKKFGLETYTADRVDKKSFAEFLGEVETYLSALAPGLLARPRLEWAAAFRDQPTVLSDVEACEAAHGNPFDWNLKGVSEALGPLLHKVCRGSAGVKLKSVLKIDGLNRWRVLAFWFQARSANDSMSPLTLIVNPDRAKDLTDMMHKLDRWDALIRDYEMKFEKDDISDKMRQAAVRYGSRQSG